MKTDKQIITDTRTIIITKSWCQGSLARDVNGRSVFIDDPNAVAFDITGAVSKVSDDKYSDIPLILIDAVSAMGYTSVIKFNDDPKTTKQHIIELLDNLVKQLNNDYYTSCYKIDPVSSTTYYNEL